MSLKTSHLKLPSQEQKEKRMTKSVEGLRDLWDTNKWTNTCSARELGEKGRKLPKPEEGDKYPNSSCSKEAQTKTHYNKTVTRQSQRENLKNSKKKASCHIQGSTHKILSEYLSSNVTGQEEVG